jgi:hypothetical protein
MAGKGFVNSSSRRRGVPGVAVKYDEFDEDEHQAQNKDVETDAPPQEEELCVSPVENEDMIARLAALVHPIFAANGHLNGVDNEDADVEENGIDDDPDRQSRDRMGKGFVHDPRTGPGRSLCGNVVTDTFGILDQPVDVVDCDETDNV